MLLIFIPSKEVLRQIQSHFVLFLPIPALFLRWTVFVQDQKVFAQMSSLLAKQYRLKLLQKCFLSIKTNLPANEIKESVRTHHRDCFPLVRVCADISQVSKRYFAVNRRGLVYCITKYNRKFLSEIRREARSAMSFRLFKSVLRMRTAKRLTVEQRVISESFYARGTKFDHPFSVTQCN